MLLCLRGGVVRHGVYMETEIKLYGMGA
jgi:hypothetical protein